MDPWGRRGSHDLARAGAGLSGKADPHPRAVRAGWGGGYEYAHPHAEDDRAPGLELRGGEPARRQWLHRHHRGRQGAGRRLHAAHGAHRGVRRQPGALFRRALRSRARLHADHHGERRADALPCQVGGELQQFPGAGARCQGEARHHNFRIGGHRQHQPPRR